MHFEARRQSQNEERGDISVTVVDIANNEPVESYEKKERMLTKLPSEKESETQLYVSQEDQVFIYEISEPEPETSKDSFEHDSQQSGDETKKGKKKMKKEESLCNRLSIKRRSKPKDKRKIFANTKEVNNTQINKSNEIKTQSINHVREQQQNVKNKKDQNEMKSVDENKTAKQNTTIKDTLQENSLQNNTEKRLSLVSITSVTKNVPEDDIKTPVVAKTLVKQPNVTSNDEEQSVPKFIAEKCTDNVSNNVSLPIENSVEKKAKTSHCSLGPVVLNFPELPVKYQNQTRSANNLAKFEETNMIVNVEKWLADNEKHVNETKKAAMEKFKMYSLDISESKPLKSNLQEILAVKEERSFIEDVEKEDTHCDIKTLNSNIEEKCENEMSVNESEQSTVARADGSSRDAKQFQEKTNKMQKRKMSLLERRRRNRGNSSGNIQEFEMKIVSYAKRQSLDTPAIRLGHQR